MRVEARVVHDDLILRSALRARLEGWAARKLSEQAFFHAHCPARQATPFSIASRTSSTELRTPSFWRMIEEVLATVL